MGFSFVPIINLECYLPLSNSHVIRHIRSSLKNPRPTSDAHLTLLLSLKLGTLPKVSGLPSLGYKILHVQLVEAQNPKP